MSGEFQSAITIKKAIEHISKRDYLLPAIQRKFVWSHEQIEMLFDSIMRGYPINSFMFWEVEAKKIKDGFKFYEPLQNYRQFFGDTNPDFTTTGYSNFKAIIDGQQRLTSLYIGLKGTYAYRLPKKWLLDTEENIPTRRLYLNLSKQLPADNERLMHYDFRFLTKKEFNEKYDEEHAIWYLVPHILTFQSDDEFDAYLDEKGWLNKEFTKKTFRRLYNIVFKEKVINYYLETIQEIDTVLDIFIRANSGGRPLSFSDLLMAITIVNWKSHEEDAKKGIEDVVHKVYEIGKPNFVINQDFVLKTCLVLVNDNIKFQVRNFDRSVVDNIERDWDRIKKSIIECFILLSNLGFNNQNLTAKNAAIPIIYYIFQRRIEGTINKPNPNDDEKSDKELIRKWLCLSLLKGFFGGQADTVLSRIRKVIKTELDDKTKQPSFPLDSIKDEFEAEATKNLSFSDDLIDGLLTTQKDEPNCFSILSLLSVMSGIKFDNADYHKDHLHPASSFYNKKQSDFPFLTTEEDFKFYSDPHNWNGIANLQLLNGILNESKGMRSLQDWVTTEKIDTSSLLIPRDVSLEFKDFRNFIEKRKEFLKSKIKQMVGA